jgi:hypothetical protein
MMITASVIIPAATVVATVVVVRPPTPPEPRPWINIHIWVNIRA